MRINNRKGFSFIELLIVCALFGVLAVAIILALDPLEQIRRGQDMATLVVAKKIDDAIFRYNTTMNKAPYPAEVEGVSLRSSEGREIVNTLIESEDLESGYSRHENTSSELFFTGQTDLSRFSLCFTPKSRSFQQNSNTTYTKYGDRIDCSKRTCYLCIGLEPSSTNQLQDDETTPSPLPQTIPSTSGCENFDNERPEYPFTCNISSKWSQYGCTNYCVSDFGCDSYCPSGQRHLKKNYYAIGNPDFELCQSHNNETGEDYCVLGIAANCNKISYPSSTTDFMWGCTSPRRPYSWK